MRELDLQLWRDVLLESKKAQQQKSISSVAKGELERWLM
jgi:hypothetical protein